jgi:ribosome modulation factor
MTDLPGLGQPKEDQPLVRVAPEGPGSEEPQAVKRRLKVSNKDGGLIRSKGVYEVSVVEGGSVARGRRATPQSDEIRSLKDHVEIASLTGSSDYGHDRIETGSRGQSSDRSEGGISSAGAKDRYLAGQTQPGAGDRYAAGQTGAAIRDDYRGGSTVGTREAAEGPSLDREGFQDRMEAGDSAGAHEAAEGPRLNHEGIRDRLEAAGLAGAREGTKGPSLDREGFQDRMEAGDSAGAHEAAEGPRLNHEGTRDRLEAAGLAGAREGTKGPSLDREGFQDRMEAGDSKGIEDKFKGGDSGRSYDDRYEGTGSNSSINDKYQPGQASSVKATGFVTLDKAISERGRIELPDDVSPAYSSHLGSRQPKRIADLLSRVPKPVFEPISYFGDAEQLNKRLTEIQGNTDLIRKALPATQEAASISRIRKVRPWQKRNPE